MKAATARARLNEQAQSRILVLDGPMGTEIQALELTEQDFRSNRFVDWPVDIRGNNDILSITQPAHIKHIHKSYLDAGADIVETNTFSATTIAQADYKMEELSYEINFESAKIAREAADEKTLQTPDRPRFVAGAIGPTNRTASISPDVNDPGYRAITFDELCIAYKQATNGLIDGGADLILIETAFDTLNAKAAIFAGLDVAKERGIDVPMMVSGTITDKSGRTLSGQTPTAFWHSVRHGHLVSVGLNCSLGAQEMRPHIAELAAVADTLICAYPNAGLPNEFGCYDETPSQTSAFLKEYAEAGLVNILGGCCGATPEHIRYIVDAVKGIPPRKLVSPAPAMRLSGLEPFVHA